MFIFSLNDKMFNGEIEVIEHILTQIYTIQSLFADYEKLNKKFTVSKFWQ